VRFCSAFAFSYLPHGYVSRLRHESSTYPSSSSSTMRSIVSLVLFVVLASAKQVPLSNAGRVASTDYTALFSAGRQLTAAPQWTRKSWNGLVTFGHAPPLRCWGVDGEEPFDIAVIGAPFDTATSFRPGFVLDEY
jgi:hypothetical protein